MQLRKLALLPALVLALAAAGATADDKVGTVRFETSCSQAVQAEFERAVAMLHSFWFSASTDAFVAIAQKDPGCAMAQWGVAMNLLGNPFGWPPAPKALGDGAAAIARAKTVGAKTQRERDYIAALETFYRDADKVEHRTRALAYRQGMEQLAARYPNDREASIFYALALNATSSPMDKTYADQLHALDYLVYAHLQMAQDGSAKRVVDHVSDLPKVTFEHFVTGFALATIPSRYALERGRWADAAKLELFGKEFPWARFPQSEAQLVFARALGAARSGDAVAARRDADRLGVLRDTLATAKVGYWAEQVDIQRQIAQAWVARAERRNDEAVALLRAAAEREDATEKHPVTPGPLAPARELLAEMLLEANEPVKALQEFESSMRVEPNRFRGLAGAARAAELAGDRTKARSYAAQLAALGEKADSERPELARAKALLGK